MPRSTDAPIEQITARIRLLCAAPFTPQAENELRKLAQDLRIAIRRHVRMAKKSLSEKRFAIAEHDPEAARR